MAHPRFGEYEQRLGPPRWDGDSSTVDVWIERVRLFTLSTKEDERVLLGPQLIRSMQPGSRQYLAAMEVPADQQTTKEGAITVAQHVKNKLSETTLADGCTELARLPTR